MQTQTQTQTQMHASKFEEQSPQSGSPPTDGDLIYSSGDDLASVVVSQALQQRTSEKLMRHNSNTQSNRLVGFLTDSKASPGSTKN
jgi:hypothetical protein